MKDTVKIAVIGLGRRGGMMLQQCLVKMKDVEIRALCDLVPAKMEDAVSEMTKNGYPAPAYTTVDYREILADPDVDAVLVMTGWDYHMRASIDSVKAGKYTAMEVGCAYSLEECYDLLKAYESTKAPVMMLENCCYGRRELAALNIVKQGLFGEIVYAEGGYRHYLPECELFKTVDGKIDTEHYRLTEYEHRNCEQYPTHELGPIAKVLNINRGNRMVSLSAVASKSRGLEDYLERHVEGEHPMRGHRFAQGDVVSTNITCAGGELIHLTLDTTLPRAFYSRDFSLQGTKGMCRELSGSRGVFYFEDQPECEEPNEKEIFRKYDHPLWAEYEEEASLGGGHGGIDWLVLRAFIEAVKRGEQTPIDVYDTVSWLSIGPLSEISIAQGGAPVGIPDFTNGKWIRREPPLTSKYSLDLIVNDENTKIMF